MVPLLEVHAVPGQAQDLSLPHPGKRRDEEHELIGISLDRLKEVRQGVVRDGADLLLLHPGDHHGVQRIGADVAEPFGLLHRFVQRAVKILDRLGREAILVQQLVVQVLNHVRGEF